MAILLNKKQCFIFLILRSIYVNQIYVCIKNDFQRSLEMRTVSAGDAYSAGWNTVRRPPDGPGI